MSEFNIELWVQPLTSDACRLLEGVFMRDKNRVSVERWGLRGA